MARQTELDRAIKILTFQYENAKRLPYVRAKMAWALYQTWKTFDREYNVNLKEAERWKGESDGNT